jgi:3',5'-cyclic AMP phosphodiesterase CpdA
MTRREFVSAAAGSAAAVGGVSAASLAADSPAHAIDRKRAIRLAHLTDIHLQPEREAAAGLAACLRHVQASPDRPELILDGGDSVMDVFANKADRARVQSDLWRSVWKAECSLPVERCIGNHDVFGWNRAKSGTTGDEPDWGKKWAMDLLGLSRRYRSSDRAGWHFVVLDSTHPRDGDEHGYTAKLDDEQFDWFAKDLGATDPKTPVLVLSHIPILCTCAFLDGKNEKTGDWQVPGAWMHIDARRIKDLFVKHPNVKLCLSGHVHLWDRCEYNGVTYVCNGAVCGGWWKGSYQETPEGYGLVDLYTDGTFDVEYVRFGWKAVPGEKDE